jgi:phosphate transport system substrate-binding protein
MVPLVLDLAEGFAANQPTVSIDVTGNGSQYGVELLESGEAEMALVSWLPADLAHRWHATAMARDGLAVVVHPDNPVDGLGLLQLQDLFSGRVYDWSALGKNTPDGHVRPVVRESGSGALSGFLAMVMAGNDLTPRAVVAPSGQAVLDFVGRNTGAIGFVAMTQATPEVKVLAIEGKWPTPQSTTTGSYPLSRELWILSAGPPSAAVQSFLDYVRGPAGQQLVGRLHGRIR